MTPFPKNTNPRRLTLTEMWELHRVLDTSKGANLESILRHTHPMKIATAMELLYGNAQVVKNGKELVWYLLQGLTKNHFKAFLKTISKD